MAMMLPTDSMFLDAEGRERPMHVGGLSLFELPDGAGPGWLGDVYREALVTADVTDRLARKARRMANGVGPWAWEADDQIDLEYHLRHSALPYPGEIKDLLALVGRLHGTLLHRSRPLWETHMIEGVTGDRFGVYSKLHHALVDGVSASRMLSRSLSTDPADMTSKMPWNSGGGRPRARGGAPATEPEGSGGLPNPFSAVTSAVGMASEAMGLASAGVAHGMRAVTGSSEAAFRTLWRSFGDQAAAVPYKAPRSMLNVPITGARRFAADGYSLERIAAVRRATGATLNDVVLAMSAGALRTYLLENDALPDQPLVAAVPMSLREDTMVDGSQVPEDDSGGNLVGIILCNLGTHLADPAARLELIRASIGRGKITMKGLNQTGVLLMSAMAFAGLGLGPLFQFEPLRQPPFNLVISNVPGPSKPMYFRGARLVGQYPLSIPLDGQAMNITVTTYAGQLQVGLVGCRHALPSLQRLLGHLDESLTELEKL